MSTTSSSRRYPTRKRRKRSHYQNRKEIVFDSEWNLRDVPYHATSVRVVEDETPPIVFRGKRYKKGAYRPLPTHWKHPREMIEKMYEEGPPDRHWARDVVKASITATTPSEGWNGYVADICTGKAQTQDAFLVPEEKAHWPENTAYASVYYNTASMKKAVEEIDAGLSSSILPSALALRSGITHQIFLSFEPTRSLLHYDDTDSLLYLCAGEKVIWLAPPNATAGLNMWKGFPRWYQHDPFKTKDTSGLWKRATLRAGDALYLPKRWLHDVDSTTPVSVGLSLNVVPSSGSFAT